MDYLKRSGFIDTLGEIWWDVRLHPGLDTVEIRAFDAQTDPARNEALVALAAALCDMLAAEYEAGKPDPYPPEPGDRREQVERPALRPRRRLHRPRDPRGGRDSPGHRRPGSAALRDNGEGPLGPAERRSGRTDGVGAPARGMAGDGLDPGGRAGPSAADARPRRFISPARRSLLAGQPTVDLLHDHLADLLVLQGLHGRAGGPSCSSAA